MFGIFGFKKNNFKNVINDSWSPKFKALVRRCNELNTDLFEMTEHHPTCAECAKYQGRVYSISGKNKKFPEVPEIIKYKGQIHSKCRHDFYPFMEGSRSVLHPDIVRFSNRPFVDDRSDEEINEYEADTKKQADLIRDKSEYKKICDKLPDNAPKTFAGYRKMKNSKSDNYQKLKEICKSVGIRIKE